MNISKLVCILLLALGPMMDSSANDVVVLERLRVEAGAYTVKVVVGVESGRVYSAKITWLAPVMKKHGLRVGDEILSIDGKVVSDMMEAEYVDLATTPVPSGPEQIVVFSGKRGLLRRVKLTTLYVTAPKKHQPNQ